MQRKREKAATERGLTVSLRLSSQLPSLPLNLPSLPFHLRCHSSSASSLPSSFFCPLPFHLSPAAVTVPSPSSSLLSSSSSLSPSWSRRCLPSPSRVPRVATSLNPHLRRAFSRRPTSPRRPPLPFAPLPRSLPTPSPSSPSPTPPPAVSAPILPLLSPPPSEGRLPLLPLPPLGRLLALSQAVCGPRPLLERVRRPTPVPPLSNFLLGSLTRLRPPPAPRPLLQLPREASGACLLLRRPLIPWRLPRGEDCEGCLVLLR